MPVGGILKKAGTPTPTWTSNRPGPGPPPPLPPIVIRSSGGSTGGLPPPKPRRFLSRAGDKTAARTFLYVDDDDELEEEPTTEDSYDYKDIDLATEVYEFKPFPPRPKPPRKRPPSGGMEFGEVEDHCVTPTTSNGLLQRRSPKEAQQDEDVVVGEEYIEKERWDGADIRMASSAENVTSAGDSLVRFMKEHEGRSLSVEDVACLGRILEAVEKEEQKAARKELVGRVDDLSFNQPTTTAAVVHFGDAEILEGMTDEYNDDNDNDNVDADRTLSDDYSEMEFHQVVPAINGTVSNAGLIKDCGGNSGGGGDGYEPVGKPPPCYFLPYRHLKQQRPDLSGFVPPVPSTIVGDPFSWRRRGRRRLCDYGYDRKADYWSTSALDKINDGCQEIEDLIVARDLTPPGTLLLGSSSSADARDIKRRKLKAVEVQSVPSHRPQRPPPPLPPKLGRTPSPCCHDDGPIFGPDNSPLHQELLNGDVTVNLGDEELEKTDDEEQKCHVGIPPPPDDVVEDCLHGDLTIRRGEKKLDKDDDVTISLEEKKLDKDDDDDDDVPISREEKNADMNGLEGQMIKDMDVEMALDGDDDIVVKQSELLLMTGSGAKMEEETGNSDAKTGQQQQQQSEIKLDTLELPTRPPRRDGVLSSLKGSQVDLDQGEEAQQNRASRRDVFDQRGQRPPRPPPPNFGNPPVRPLRHKRFRSAEPSMMSLEVPSSSSTTMISTPNLLVNSASLDNNKPKRSASFHTAEDIRRRIDVQAQHFLRTPRRREGFGNANVNSSAFASTCSLKYDCLRRRNRSPAPLYSLVNKAGFSSRKKLMASSGSQTDLTGPPLAAPAVAAHDNSPTPPIPKRDDDDDDKNVDDERDVEKAVQQFNEWADMKRLETTTSSEALPEEEVVKAETAAVDLDRRNASRLNHNRPLPAPPPPPRQRSLIDKTMAGFPSGVAVLLCHHEGKMVAGGGLPEMKVLRLTVGHLEASTLRVSHMEADVFKTTNSLERNFSLPPSPRDPDLPPTSGASASASGPDNSASGRQVNDAAGEDHRKRSDQTDAEAEKKGSTDAEDDDDTTPTDGCCPITVVEDAKNFTTLAVEGEASRPASHRDSLDTVSLTVVSLNDDFDDFTSTKDDPFTSGGTTSDSASYVTCDETIQGDDDDVGFTDDLLDDEFDLNLELDGIDDDEDAATGCPTPTELEMDLTLGDDDDDDDCDVHMITPAPTGPTDENCNVGNVASANRMALTPDSISSSSSSSSSGVEGIVKMRKMKLKGRLGDNTNSWYDEGDVPGQMADNDVSDHHHHHHRRHQSRSTPAKSSLFESGSSASITPASSWTKDDADDDEVNSEAEAGSLIKQRIAALLADQSQRGGNSTNGSGGSSSACSSVNRLRPSQDRYCRSPNSRRKCRPKRRDSKFYLAPEDAPAPACGIESEVGVVVSTSEVDVVVSTSDVEAAPAAVGLQDNAPVEEDSGTLRDDISKRPEVLEGRLQSSSEEDEEEEDASVASSSSPRNLSAYSENAFAAFGDGGRMIDGDLAENGHGLKRSRAFYIARELMTSEKVFVDVLNLLTKDFLEAIDRAAAKTRESIVPEEVLAQILDCLPQLKCFNEDLLRDLEERIEKWDEIQRVSDVIVCKGPFLKLYTMYIKRFPVLTKNLEEACKKYPHFAQAVRDFEMSDRCKKLELKHYMLKPVQRIPQYRMLLQDYLKNIEPDSPDYAYTEAALAIVSEVATHANDSMKEGDKFAELLQIQSRIAGNHEVIKPGRTFIKEGELRKLCRKEMQLRTFILFTDSLLHLSVGSQGLLRVHHELPLSNMKVSVPTQEDFQNEFSVINVARSFTLSASSAVERDEWIFALNSAIQKTVSRHASFLQAKLHQLHIPEHRIKNEALGEQAPVWIPDSRVTMCQLCLHEFTLTFRRHHCRACGKVVCAICSANRAPLFYRNYETARVCDECFVVLKKEIDDRASFNESTIVSGNVSQSENPADEQRSRMPSLDDLKAQFKKYYRGGSTTDQKHKRQLPRVLKEVCANDTGSSMSGYLYKRLKRTWRRGWFVIKDKVLYSYRASQDVAALDSTPLLGFEVVTFTEHHDGIHHQLIFELRHPGHPIMEFYAESLKSAERWLEAVKKATVLE